MNSALAKYFDARNMLKRVKKTCIFYQSILKIETPSFPYRVHFKVFFRIFSKFSAVLFLLTISHFLKKVSEIIFCTKSKLTIVIFWKLVCWYFLHHKFYRIPKNRELEIKFKKLILHFETPSATQRAPRN